MPKFKLNYNKIQLTKHMLIPQGGTKTSETSYKKCTIQISEDKVRQFLT
jgi:hypothetical protein